MLKHFSHSWRERFLLPSSSHFRRKANLHAVEPLRLHFPATASLGSSKPFLFLSTLLKTTWKTRKNGCSFRRKNCFILGAINDTLLFTFRFLSINLWKSNNHKYSTTAFLYLIVPFWYTLWSHGSYSGLTASPQKAWLGSGEGRGSKTCRRIPFNPSSPLLCCLPARSRVAYFFPISPLLATLWIPLPTSSFPVSRQPARPPARRPPLIMCSHDLL